MAQVKMAKPSKVKKKRKISKSKTQQRPHQDLERAARIVKPQKNRRRKKLKGVDESYIKEWEGTKKGKRRARPAAVPIPAPKAVSDQYEQQDTAAERQLAHLKDMVKNMPKSKLKGKGNPFYQAPKEDTRGMTKKMKKVPRFAKGKKETDGAFMARVELAAQRVISAAQFEDKYKVEVEDPDSGKLAAKKQSKKTKKNTKRLQEKKIKKKEKLNEKLENKKSGFERFTDEVQFGEVAMAPPEIKAVPRKADKTGKKPGERSLLLKQFFGGQSCERRQVGQTQRRKNLSPAQQLMMDAERTKAIDLYRQMKARKMAGVDGSRGSLAGRTLTAPSQNMLPDNS